MTTIEIKEGEETPTVDEAVDNAATVAEQAHDQAVDTLKLATEIAGEIEGARKEGEAVERTMWEGFNEVLGLIGEVNRKQDEILSRLDALENISITTLAVAADPEPEGDPAPELEAAAVAVESAAETVEVAADVIQEPQERGKPRRKWL